jgi:hypothetical protein
MTVSYFGIGTADSLSMLSEVRLWHDLDRAFSRHGAEVPVIERCDPATMPLGASDHRGIGKAQRHVCVSAHEMTYPLVVAVAAIYPISLGIDVVDKCAHHMLAQVSLNKICHLGQNAAWNEQLVAISYEGVHY